MSKVNCVLASAIILLSVASASASIVLENFEPGSPPSFLPPSFPSGWNVTITSGSVGVAWQVGTTTASSPNVDPAPLGGEYFAFSGRPNVNNANQPTETIGREEAIGVVTSPLYIVSYTMLEWLSVGWSGSGDSPTIDNRFEILNSSGSVMATIGAAQNDAWETATITFSAINLFAGDGFRFRAIDSNSGGNFAWIGFDNLTLTGEQLELPTGVVPEATSFLIWGLLGLSFVVGGWKRRE